jgi:hypothetical protein
MKKVITSILQAPCRMNPVTDEDRAAFPKCEHLQRYHPGLDNFPLPCDQDRVHASLPHSHRIVEWKGSEDGRIFQAVVEDASGSRTDGKVFVKTVHLLDPIALLQNEYMMPSHPLLPVGDKAWKTTLLKLHGNSNQAYVDAVASYVIGQLRHKGVTPHGVMSYGSMTGIATTYQYRITDEFESYRQCRWFWKGLKTHAANLSVDKEELTEMVTTCPFDDIMLGAVEEEVLCVEEQVADDQVSLHSFDAFDEVEEKKDEEDDDEDEDEDEEDEEDENEEDEEDEEDDESEESTVDINLVLPSMPVILICQEAQDGTVDMLMDMEEIDGIKRDTPAWDTMWLAWIFQFVATLSFLQKHISFTHNDLHTNNIVWRKTDIPFLHYRAQDGTVWRVPTYGRIFSLIDFGRAIFKFQDKLWISDDHWPDHDAGGQYNFGPFYSIESPKITPNTSFDLCRLAISMLEGLYDEHPAKKKGAALLSQEGNWKVYESISPLFNLLWKWTLDDDGRTVYEDKDGDEKYPGFDLYVIIARTVHDAVPREQVRKPVFEQFLWKGKLPDEVYSIGC